MILLMRVGQPAAFMIEEFIKHKMLQWIDRGRSYSETLLFPSLAPTMSNPHGNKEMGTPRYLYVLEF